jgi:ligand-binding sensor domain-containing protein
LKILKLVDAKGNTFKSGVELALSKVIHDMFFPAVKDALPPRYKGNDIDGFTYLDIEQGLPSSYTIGLAFDSLDNLWTGTSDGGLVKYDGKTFIQFDYNSGMPDEQIYDVLIDKNGHIWLSAIDIGLILFDGHNFITFPELPQVEGWCLLESSDGSIWFGTNGYGIFKIVSKGRKFYCTHYSTEQGLAGNVIRDIDEDSQGNIVISTYRNGYSVFDGKSFYNYGKEQGLPATSLFKLVISPEGDYYFATFGEGIIKVSNGNILKLTSEQGLCSDYLLSVFISSNGDLWAGSLDNGLSVIDKRNIKNYHEDNGLAYNIIHDFVEYKYGNIWIRPHHAEIAIYQKGSFKIMTEDQGLANRFAQSISSLPKSDLLFGLDYGFSILSDDITNYQLGNLLIVKSILSASYDS